MDSIAAMVAEAIARRVKEAQARGTATLEARAAAGDPQARQVLDRVRAAGLEPAQPAPARAVPAANQAPAPANAAPSPPAGATSNTEGLDVFPSLPLAILDGDIAERPRLLNAFSGSGLLSGIVLAEALAKPLSLRENGSGGAF